MQHRRLMHALIAERVSNARLLGRRLDGTRTRLDGRLWAALAGAVDEGAAAGVEDVGRHARADRGAQAAYLGAAVDAGWLRLRGTHEPGTFGRRLAQLWPLGERKARLHGRAEACMHCDAGCSTGCACLSVVYSLALRGPHRSLTNLTSEAAARVATRGEG